MTSQVPAARDYARHAEGSAELAAPPDEVFDFLDDHRNLSGHMGSGNSSPLMGGGQMQLVLDEGQGKRVGSHIVMTGTAFGFDLFLDEVVVERAPGVRKTWQTVDDRLVVIGAYRLGFVLEPRGAGTLLRVWIDYDLPTRHRWLGRLGGGVYARWCVRQMLSAATTASPWVRRRSDHPRPDAGPTRS